MIRVFRFIKFIKKQRRQRLCDQLAEIEEQMKIIDSLWGGNRFDLKTYLYLNGEVNSQQVEKFDLLNEIMSMLHVGYVVRLGNNFRITPHGHAAISLMLDLELLSN